MAAKKWYQQKTTWAGIGSILTGVGGVASQSIDVSTGLMMTFQGFMAIFGRQALK
jgi:hypothetical protein